MLDPTKGWFSAQELAGLPGMPGTDSAVMRAAKKNLWSNRRKLRGKGVEYYLTSLPAETQKHILGLVMNQAVEAPAMPVAQGSTLPAVQTPGPVVTARGQIRKSAEMVTFSDWHRAYQDGALVLCRAIDAAVATADCSVKRACQELAERLVCGEAHVELQAAATATYLKPRKGAGPLGGVAQVSRLQKMMAFYEQGRLAGDGGRFLVAGKREKAGHNPIHVACFLRFFCLC